MDGQADVVVIGAGIVGCSVAYHLSRLGWGAVTVVDQGPLFETGGSTSHAPGLVFQTSASRAMTMLARQSVALYAELSLAGSACFAPVGSLEVATTAARWDDLQRKWGWARAWGLRADLITPAAASARLPLLDPGAIRGALAVPADGIARPVQAAEAMAVAARARGSRFLPRATVTGIEVAGGRVRAVVTTAGRVAADHVVVAAGIWGPRVGALANVAIPLTPVQHQYARTGPLPALAGELRDVVHPILRHQDRDLYFRQHADRYGVGSYQHAPRLVDPASLPDHQQTDRPAMMPFTEADFVGAWDDAVRLLPALRDTAPTEGFNGLFSFTPDGLPLLGEAAAVRGLWIAEAVWITHAGGAGQAIAEWMTHGVPELDLRECDANRFEPHALSPRYVSVRGAQQYREVYDVIHPLQPLEQPRSLRVSPFHRRQEALGAVCFEGRGWERPQWFAANEDELGRRREAGDVLPARTGWAARFWSPISAIEHLATRERVALYDMSPLGKIEVAGPGALAFLQHLTVGQLDRPVGRITYTLMLDQRGGVKSDITVTRLAEQRFQIGSNGPLDLVWLRRHLPMDSSVQVDDATTRLCCVGVWGPRARALVAPLCATDCANAAFPYLTARTTWIGEVPVLAQRISYVGELGWELYTSPDYGQRLWDLLWEAGQPLGVIAGGRGAFDSLRLEKGYRLWGVDMHTEYSPDEAGLGFAVKLDKSDFIGRAALLRRRAEGIARRLCCLVLDDTSVVVMGKEPIVDGETIVGYVTSAAYGASLRESIAYGYLPADRAEPGTRLAVEYFGRLHPATVVAEPRYDPTGRALRS